MEKHVPSAASSGPHTLLWIRPLDDEKIPVDPVFLDAAHRMGIDFFLYRARELSELASTSTSELVERAVHCASRAQKGQPVRDPVGYLWCTFTRLVERELSRARRFEPLTDEIVYSVNRSPFENPQAEWDRSLEWQETLDQVGPEMRWVLWQMVWGYTVKEIAERLGVKPATLYKRLSRIRKELQKKRIESNPPSAGRSKGNGEKPERRQLAARRAVKETGADGAPCLSQSHAPRLPQ